jgi:hypothetical protein
MDSLQLISVTVSNYFFLFNTEYTRNSFVVKNSFWQATFFVAIEATLLRITVPLWIDPGLSRAGQIANIGLVSALVVHAHTGKG